MKIESQSLNIRWGTAISFSLALCVLNKIAWELWALGELSSGRLSGSWSSPLGNSLNLLNESITKCTSVCNILSIASTVKGQATQCLYIFFFLIVIFMLSHVNRTYFKTTICFATQHQASYKMFALRNASAGLSNLTTLTSFFFWTSLVQTQGYFWLDEAKWEFDTIKWWELVFWKGLVNRHTCWHMSSHGYVIQQN